MHDLSRMIEMAKRQMPAQRWEHTLGVVQTAKKLARQFGADERKAEIAAYLHDYVKYWSVEEQKKVIVKYGLSPELLEYDAALWHAPAGAEVVREQFGITDEEILDAIRYHTSGRVNMTLLDKIVCLADYIEPGRQYPGVDRIRALAENDLDEALLAGFNNTIRFLIEQNRKIYPLIVMARNDLIRR